MWNKLYQGRSPGKTNLSGHYTRFKIRAISKLAAAGRDAGPLGAFRRKSVESADPDCAPNLTGERG
jgi:hypothetical protein